MKTDVSRGKWQGGGTRGGDADAARLASQAISAMNMGRGAMNVFSQGGWPATIRYGSFGGVEEIGHQSDLVWRVERRRVAAAGDRHHLAARVVAHHPLGVLDQ